MMRPLPLKFFLLTIIFSAITCQAAIPQGLQKSKHSIKTDNQPIDTQREITVPVIATETGTVALKADKVSPARAGKELLTENSRVYPVPATSDLTVTGLENVSLLEIFDVMGNKIISEQCEGMDIKTLNISHLARGIYFLRLTTPLGAVMKRFVKE
ncbi:MAG: T9SS type A sorting domain-containing protein [Bacteroidales bacterium]